MPDASQWTSFSTADTTPMGTLAALQAIKDEIIPEHKLARISGWGEPQNLSAYTNDVGKIQAYIRAAERGDMVMLYALYRDIIMGDSHIQSEFAKRKMVVAGQPYDLNAVDKDDPDDMQAVDAIQWMIEHTDNWDEGILHLLDASLISQVAAEKLYEPYQPRPKDKLPIRFRLKKISPINYTLLTYLVAYIPQGTIGLPSYVGFAKSAQTYPTPTLGIMANPAMVYDPDDWEPELRFFSVFPNGIVNRSWSSMYLPEPERHIIHKANLFPGIRDNYGASMRALLFWWFLGVQGRDWWGRFMERFASPFLAGKVDAQDVNAVAGMTAAIQGATKLSGIIIDKKAEIEIHETSVTNASQGYEGFLNYCNREKSKLILGHADASESKKEGLTKGTGKQVSELRDDFRQFDQKMLANTLRTQLFEPFLRINGFQGEAPKIVWGGEDNEGAAFTSSTLQSLSGAGIRPTKKALDQLSEKFGFELEFAPDLVAKSNEPFTPTN